MVGNYAIYCSLPPNMLVNRETEMQTQHSIISISILFKRVPKLTDNLNQTVVQVSLCFDAGSLLSSIVFPFTQEEGFNQQH